MRIVRDNLLKCLIALLMMPCCGPAASQIAPFTGKRAATATELPLGAWGPYVGGHSEPCYLADRLKAQLFAFPIVIGQRRTETLLHAVKDADGKPHLRLGEVSIVRRLMGLSPVQAAGDDRSAPSPRGAANRISRITDADADGLLWTAKAAFQSSGMAQSLGGAELPAWGAGEATVECFPAFAEPAADGLLLRITLTNRADARQTWYVDLLGGMATLNADFLLHDLRVTPDAAGKSVGIRHPAADAVFALTADAVAFPVHACVVSNAYFGPEGAIEERDAAGRSSPHGVLTAEADGKQPPGDNGVWGLTRVEDITVAPGGTVSFFLCIGVGKDAIGARQSAAKLSLLAADSEPGDAAREGAYTLAAKAHAAARFQSGDAALDRLMAQSLANVPFRDWRRIGVASRQTAGSLPGGLYRPEEGGLIALGWAAYRPELAAAQLNAWFLAQNDPGAPAEHPRAVTPTNLFALWELYQHRHDREMLAAFYPAARARYQEFLTAGRATPDSWLFSWPTPGVGAAAGAGTVRPAALLSGPEAAAGREAFDVDYCAYVIRSAGILTRIAYLLDRPAAEIEAFIHDGNAAAAALKQTESLPGAKADTARDLIALIAGSDALSPAREAALLGRLTDPAGSWTPFGVKGVFLAAPSARQSDPDTIDFGANWLLWKALLDRGEAGTARTLAANLVRAYHAASIASDGSPRALNAAGEALGPLDFSGGACALIPMMLAYHQPGEVATGWDIAVLDRRYDRSTDAMHIVFRPANAAGKASLICVLGKPNGKYSLSGSLQGVQTADATGVLTLTAPRDATTQQIDITPAGAP